jgi:adhesin transport system outer membrane protein
MKKHWTLMIPGALLLCATPAAAIELRDAVQAALQTNPEIRQAIHNKEATLREREQAEGLWLPRISVEASAGVRNLDNPTRRSAGIDDETLWPLEASATADQLLFDMGGRQAEIRRQASRTDAAAARVEERSEYVALNVAAPTSITAAAAAGGDSRGQCDLPRTPRGDLREGVAKGSISIADQQQAEERLQSARARVTEAREDLETAGIQFRTLAGVPIDSVSMPPDLSQCMPATLEEAEALARQYNPRVQESIADLSTARELITAAKSDMGPRFNLEGTARVGDDVDGGPLDQGVSGRTTDLAARVVMRWLVFNGGTNIKNVREQQARADEAHARLFEMTRRAEEDARSAWSRLTNQGRLVTELEDAEPRFRRPAPVLSRAVQRRPPLAARRARCAEHALQRPGPGRDGAHGQALCPVSRARFGQQADRVPWRPDADGGLERRADAVQGQSDPGWGSARKQHAAAGDGSPRADRRSISEGDRC